MDNSIKVTIEQKTELLKQEVFSILHQYPNHFIQGLFEPVAEQDFLNSEIAIARQRGNILGCLMFNPKEKEFNWLAISRNQGLPKTDIAKALFEICYSIISPGTTVHLFVNTEDASSPDLASFSGKNFEPARNFYRSMGLEIHPKNRIENKYGPGAHVYKVEWVPNI